MIGFFTKEAIESARRSIQMTAVRFGVPEPQVREEMMAAIREGRGSSDPKIRAQWEEIPWSTGEPDVEEFVAWMAMRVKIKE